MTRNLMILKNSDSTDLRNEAAIEGPPLCVPDVTGELPYTALEYHAAIQREVSEKPLTLLPFPQRVVFMKATSCINARINTTN